jgi:hypothetical protein
LTRGVSNCRRRYNVSVVPSPKKLGASEVRASIEFRSTGA